MKMLLLQILFMGIFVSCSKENEQKSEVEIYIQQVRENKYSADSLPEFSPDAIPLLLVNANDLNEISKFPANPLTSQGPLRVTVCSVLLWTIEHIRLNYGNYSENQYPSNLPELMKVGQEIRTLDDVQLLEVYNLYTKWWDKNKGIDFEIIRKINPLELSNYVWK